MQASLRLLAVGITTLILFGACRSGDGGGAPADTSGPDAVADTALPADAVLPDGAPADVAEAVSADGSDAAAADVPPSTLPRGCEGASLPGVPDDPALPGPWPVGARTVVLAGLTAEVWYPAVPGSEAALQPVRYDVREQLPEGEGEKIPDAENPWQVCDCWPALPLDEAHGPYPLVLFVHGTAGFRSQSIEQTVHWASRGFVVVAVDHPGLRLADVLTFDFADRDLEGDVTRLLDALAAPAGEVAFLAGHLAEGRVGLAGHSAGGATVAAFAGRPGVRVIVPMAGGGVVPAEPSDLELALVVAAIDDGIMLYSQIEDGFAETPWPRALAAVANAGHLLPTSLCALGAEDGGLLQIAIDNGVDVPAFIAALATDGCGPTQLPPAEGWAVVNAVTSLGLESVLHCTGAFAEQFPTLPGTYPALAVARYEPAAPPVTPFPWSAESWDAVCGNGVDDDGNGFGDCDDFACSRNPAVTVCGSAAVWETSPAECANGRDDDGDGRADCADPDCAENRFHEACPAPAVEDGCATGADGDGDGLAGCADRDCVLRRLGGCEDGGRARVLFDQTLDETSAAGPNSDWVVDGLAAYPTPSDPAGPDDWAGALSSFGYALVASDSYLVESLPSTDGRLTFEDDANPQDLARYDVLVLYEPSRALRPEERAAIQRFVAAGGGLLLVANHVGADRDGNGVAAPQALNGLLDDETIGADPFGFRFDEVDRDTGAPLDDVVADHPVTAGPAGAVDQLGFYQGCSAHLTGGNGTALGLVFLPAAADATQDIAVGAAEVGSGRVVFVTDSAVGGDGTDSHGSGDPAHDSWNHATQDNAALFLNALAWLARRP